MSEPFRPIGRLRDTLEVRRWVVLVSGAVMFGAGFMVGLGR